MKRDIRVKQFEYQDVKTSKEFLYTAFNREDYLIIDRSELDWEDADLKNVVLVKTFAPLTGQVLEEDSLKNFPIFLPC